MGRFRSNFGRRIRIRNQNQPFTSGFWDEMSSFSTTLSLQNEPWKSHERFFFTKRRPYQVFTFIRTTLRKKCMQQNFFCCPDKTFCCPNKTFCLSNQNLVDIPKCFFVITKEFCCINTNKIFLLIWKNCFLSEPYEHSHWLFGAYHSAFENLSCKFVLAGFDRLWIRIYSQKIDISISKMAESKWRIEIYEIKRFRSLKTLYSKLL